MLNVWSVWKNECNPIILCNRYQENVRTEDKTTKDLSRETNTSEMFGVWLMFEVLHIYFILFFYLLSPSTFLCCECVIAHEESRPLRITLF